MEEISESLRQAGERRTALNRQLKIIGLGVITLVLQIGVWWTLNQSMFGGKHPAYWLWPVGLTALWVSFVSFFAIVNRSQAYFAGLNVLGLLAYLAVMPRDVYVFAGGVVFFLLSLFFQKRVQAAEKHQLNFSLRRTLGFSQTIMTYALLVMLGFLIYHSTSAEFKSDPGLFYRKTGETVARSLPMFQRQGSRYDLTRSMDEFLADQIRETYPEYDQIPAEQRQDYLRQASEEFARQFGVQTEYSQSLQTVVVEVIRQRLEEVLGPYERFLPLIFTVLVITVLRTFAFVFNWLTLFISWLLYRLLLAINFFRLRRVPVEVEKLDI